MQAAHMRGTRQASVHAQAGKTSKVRHAGKGCAQPAMQCRARKLSAGWSTEIKGDQKLNVRRRRSKMAASELGQQLVWWGSLRLAPLKNVRSSYDFNLGIIQSLNASCEYSSKWRTARWTPEISKIISQVTEVAWVLSSHASPCAFVRDNLRDNEQGSKERSTP